jgi:hypothetical protein
MAYTHQRESCDEGMGELFAHLFADRETTGSPVAEPSWRAIEQYRELATVQHVMLILVHSRVQGELGRKSSAPGTDVDVAGAPPPYAPPHGPAGHPNASRDPTAITRWSAVLEFLSTIVQSGASDAHDRVGIKHGMRLLMAMEWATGWYAIPCVENSLYGMCSAVADVLLRGLSRRHGGLQLGERDARSPYVALWTQLQQIVLHRSYPNESLEHEARNAAMVAATRDSAVPLTSPAEVSAAIAAGAGAAAGEARRRQGVGPPPAITEWQVGRAWVQSLLKVGEDDVRQRTDLASQHPARGARG